MSYPHHKGSENSNKEQYIQEEGNKVIIKPGALDIIWGNDARYWRLDKKTGGRGTAELVQVCWLEVNGSYNLKSLNPNTDYKLQFKLKLNPDAFGWNENPIYIMTKFGKNGRPNWTSVNLSQIRYGVTFLAPNDQKKPLIFRFENKDEELHFGLFEVWSGRWKGGLVIEEVVIVPCS